MLFNRFRSVAHQRPDSIALKDPEREVSYAGLLADAERIRAKASTVSTGGPGVIGLLFKDRCKAVAAMLGVGGSKNAYIPLDPNDPDERLRFIANDARVAAVISESGLVARARSIFEDRCSVIDADVDGECEPFESTSPDSEHPLYILYTSGSTGRPKGVIQSHRNLLFYVDSYIQRLELGPNDRLSWLYNYSVSASNMDIYPALLSGAALCSFDAATDGLARFADFAAASDMTVLHTAPSVLRAILDVDPGGRAFRHLRVVDISGEPLHASDVARVRAVARNGCRIFNRLAATEICFIATNELLADARRDAEVIPVGKTPAEVEVRIVGEEGEELGRGETGRIVVESPYVSPGYVNDEALTAKVFSVVEGRTGWRRYLSSDLGMIDSEGDLHFIGREDSRVKVRGHAVDLREIEAALNACEGVKESAVIVRESGADEVRELIACVSTSRGRPLDPNSLRERLAMRLPAFMLPNGYVVIDALPMTASGKVDRKALGRLDFDSLRYRPDFEEPKGETETAVAGMFSELLGMSPVGRHDDFFLLGGDSLRLVELQIMCRSRFGREIENVTTTSTVASIAEQISQRSGSPRISRRIIPVRTEGSLPPLFLVHGRAGFAHVGRHFLSLLGEEQPLYGIQARGIDGREAPHASVKEMAEDYVREILDIHPNGPHFLGGLCTGSYVAAEMAQILRAEGRDVLPLLLIGTPPLTELLGSRHIDRTHVMGRIRMKLENGWWRFDSEKHVSSETILENVLRLEDVFSSYRTDRPYDLPGCAVQTAIRLRRQKLPLKYRLWRILHVLTVPPARREKLATQSWGSRRGMRKVFGKRLKIFEVDGQHVEMFDPKNESFAEALRQALEYCRAR